MSKQQIEVREGDQCAGDVFVRYIDESWLVVEREVPDVPTRVVAKAMQAANARGLGSWIADLPEAWANEDCTVILGKDELPEDVKRAVETPDPRSDACGWASGKMGTFIRSRWPEAFKEKP
jgi:hypothetical protein